MLTEMETGNNNQSTCTIIIMELDRKLH